jgi:hypothetical protein
MGAGVVNDAASSDADADANDTPAGALATRRWLLFPCVLPLPLVLELLLLAFTSADTPTTQSPANTGG